MSPNYGQKIEKALAAVRQMHSDASRLMQDCDGTIGRGKQSAFGNYVTHELSWNVRADFWMAEAVYRYYFDKDKADGVILGLTVCFFDKEGRIEEPYLLVGKIKYRVDGNAQIKGVCKGWDLWDSFFDWIEDRDPHIVHFGQKADDSRIEWFKVLGVPLYSITSMQMVEELMERFHEPNPT